MAWLLLDYKFKICEKVYIQLLQQMGKNGQNLQEFRMLRKERFKFLPIDVTWDVKFWKSGLKFFVSAFQSIYFDLEIKTNSQGDL